jgi:hypothetical protein
MGELLESGFARFTGGITGLALSEQLGALLCNGCASGGGERNPWDDVRVARESGKPHPPVRVTLEAP